MTTIIAFLSGAMLGGVFGIIVFAVLTAGEGRR